MCFSAQASFVTAGCLYSIAALCWRAKTTTTNRLAYIPLLFALQQTTEGIAWLALAYRQPTVAVAMGYLFLLFAFGIWPWFVPATLHPLEHDRLRARIIHILMYVGGILALFAYGTVLYGGTEVSITDGHLQYHITMSDTCAWLATIIYLLCTVGAGLTSSNCYARIFAILVGIGYAISYYTYYHQLISVWCFFAALLSCCVYWIVTHEQDQHHTPHAS